MEEIQLQQILVPLQLLQYLYFLEICLCNADGKIAKSAVLLTESQNGALDLLKWKINGIAELIRPVRILILSMLIIATGANSASSIDIQVQD